MDALGKKVLAKIDNSFLKIFPLYITGSRSFDAAQICQGGVSLEEVDSQFMQSLLCPGLFFAGELLDVAENAADTTCNGHGAVDIWRELLPHSIVFHRKELTMIQISQIRLKPDSPETALHQAVYKALRLSPKDT